MAPLLALLLTLLWSGRGLALDVGLHASLEVGGEDARDELERQARRQNSANPSWLRAIRCVNVAGYNQEHAAI